MLASSPNILHLRGVGDQEMQGAIEELQRSTVAIEKHMELLRIQQDAMKTLVNTNKQHYEARESTEDGQHKMWTVEATHTKSAVSFNYN